MRGNNKTVIKLVVLLHTVKGDTLNSFALNKNELNSKLSEYSFLIY